MQPGQHAEYTTRNREHQRRSRARRKEYINDLEARIRQFEREGAQASVAVQIAAKRVVEENRLLREFLNAQGVSTAAIESHLKACTTSSNSGAPDSAAKSQKPLQRRQLVKSATAPKLGNADTSAELREDGTVASNGAPYYRKSAIDTADAVSNVPKESSVTYITPHFSSPLVPGQAALQVLKSDAVCSRKGQEVADYGSSDSELQTNTSPTEEPIYESVPQPLPSIDEMSCTDAARIIASLRGHQDPESLWSELGCSTERKCMVKRVRVFELA
ncbi:hypothetical protein MMC10_005393 [Thelotrema lepadinum]|nr:hypothetical protein [Thelotrema lepadinum]